MPMKGSEKGATTPRYEEASEFLVVYRSAALEGGSRMRKRLYSVCGWGRYAPRQNSMVQWEKLEELNYAFEGAQGEGNTIRRG